MSLVSSEDSVLLDSANSHFDQIYDAVHGTIDFQSFGQSKFTQQLRSILDSKFMRRLQQVKQLGFVSKNYISAGHNRYTHSLGTMKMMRDICSRLAHVRAFSRRELPILRNLARAFPETFSKRSESPADLLTSHLLVAALVQDIGELPYNIATATFLLPSPKVRETVVNALQVDVTNCEPKIIFALYWLCHEDNAKNLDGLSLPLLAYLISGRRPSSVRDFPGLRALRHMTDGAVDADRLDYVHRDAFHTIGVKRSPEAVIASLLYYDDEGPVFSSPGPVSDFLATRAILWSSVYLAPSNRFRIVLFSHILRDLREQLRRGRSQIFGSLSDDGIEYEQLLDIDDLWMDNIVRKVSEDVTLLRTPRAAAAARALTSAGTPSYDYFWLGPAPAGTDNGKADFDFNIPDQLFWDSYSDYQSHTLYAHRSIRINVNHYKYLGGSATLEDCSGPFNAMLAERSSALPMPGRLLMFRPKNPARLPAWGGVETRIADHSLYNRLKYEDTVGFLDFKQDTRHEDGFKGAPIFISFAWEDVLTVRRIASDLYKRKQRYYCLWEPYVGVGATARKNSCQAVLDASAVLLLYSLNYANKFKHQPQGNLASEVYEMIIRKRQAGEQFKIVPLTIENYSTIGVSLPWLELGFEDGQPPMFGHPLKNATDEQIMMSVDALLAALGVRS